MTLLEAQKKAVRLKEAIEALCILEELNLTIYDGGIGFVDHTLGKIVMVWRPEYKMPDKVVKEEVTQ